MVGLFCLGLAVFLVFLTLPLLRSANLYLVACLGLLFSGLLFFHLFVTGSADRTGHLWYYPFILCSLLILGKKRGSIATLLLLVPSALFMAAGFSLPGFDAAHYTAEFQIKFVLSALLIFLYSYIAEDLRERTNGLLTRKNSDLESAVASLKQAHAALRESEDIHRNLVERATDGIVVVQDKAVKYANPRAHAIGGFATGEIKDRPFADYIYPCERPRVADYYEQRMRGETPPSNYETALVDKNGGRVDVEFSAGIISYKGRPADLIVIRDITDRKKAEEEKELLEAQLLQSQRLEAIGTLAGGIAHNFNNLLMGVQGTASLMLLDIDPDHPHYGLLENLEGMVKNGANLTAQLLGYAREGRYEARPLDLNRLVIEVSETLSSARREIRIHRDLSDGLYEVEADKGQIEQVLLNLCVNSAEAMSKGGDLFLSTLNVTHEHMKARGYSPEPGNYAMLTVRDTGRGMDRGTLRRIFEPFFTTKGLAEGTGLGLAASYGIIKNHGGYIEAYSESGKGTSFEICLPAIRDSETGKKRTSADSSRGRETVLLVDDEETVLNVGRGMLERLGYEILVARTGMEAVEAYNENQGLVDLVILDMVLPDMGGGEVYDRIKHLDQEVKVLLSSGYALDGQATEILKRGCQGFLQKPFSISQLAGKISEILEAQ